MAIRNTIVALLPQFIYTICVAEYTIENKNVCADHVLLIAITGLRLANIFGLGV